jgi:hypothetical protein
MHKEKEKDKTALEKKRRQTLKDLGSYNFKILNQHQSIFPHYSRIPKLFSKTNLRELHQAPSPGSWT